MEYFIFILKSALFDFSRNKGRTFLTSLGILIGVLSVILLIAFGLGLRKYIGQQFESLGTNLVFVMPGSKDSLLRGGGLVGGIRFDDNDVKKLDRLRALEYVAPAFSKTGVAIEANGKREPAEIVASNEDVIPVFNLKLEKGRLLTKADVIKGDKIALVSPRTAEKLFGSVTASIGKIASIGDQNFKIVGVYESKGGGFGGNDMDVNVYIPFKASYTMNPEKKYYGIYVKVRDQNLLASAKKQMEDLLQKRYDEDEFSVLEQTEILNTIGQIFGIVNLVLVAISAISLVVGGIGIMNIMYVTVTERIREIGIRRAIGARKLDILLHFLVESILLSVFGGVLALILAYAILFFVQQFFPAYIDLQSVLLALGVSSAIGIIFGVFPAKKAADLSPIDAIRYE